MKLRKTRHEEARVGDGNEAKVSGVGWDLDTEAEPSSPGIRLVSLKPMPTEEELAAMVVAVEQALVKPTVEDNVVEKAETVWKFANRWWQGSRRGRSRPNRTPY